MRCSKTYMTAAAALSKEEGVRCGRRSLTAFQTRTKPLRKALLLILLQSMAIAPHPLRPRPRHRPIQQLPRKRNGLLVLCARLPKASRRRHSDLRAVLRPAIPAIRALMQRSDESHHVPWFPVRPDGLYAHGNRRELQVVLRRHASAASCAMRTSYLLGLTVRCSMRGRPCSNVVIGAHPFCGRPERHACLLNAVPFPFGPIRVVRAQVHCA